MELKAIELGIHEFRNAKILTESADKQYTYVASGNNLLAIDEIEQVYNKHRHAVITLIYASPAQSFSDAFRLREEEDG